ncbi:MAG: serine/threonine-protein kinase [Planctomycetaceae bacterium]
MSDLLVEWEEAREKGVDLPAELLCRDCVHLLPHLKERIRLLVAGSWMHAGGASSTNAAILSTDVTSGKSPDLSQTRFRGGEPLVADEMTDILRRRLKIMAIAISIWLGLGLVRSWLVSVLYFPVEQVSAFVLSLACVWLLISSRPLSFPFLRRLELGMYWGTIAYFDWFFFNFVKMMAARENADFITWGHYVFSIYLISATVTYGITVPNHWRRAAWVIATSTVTSSAMLYWIRVKFPVVQDLQPWPLLLWWLVALLAMSVIAILATHSLYSLHLTAAIARRIGPYEVGKRLGAGGMGEVYEAEHRLLKRRCALKFIRSTLPRSATVLGRFENEVQAAAALSHPNTIDIYDFGETSDGAFYYSMELLPGMNFQELVARHGPQRPERVVYLLRQVCSALEEAHATGLIHRDIKPANLFASKRGGNWDVAKLLDFGLALWAEGGDGSSASGSVAGTPLYISPEQLQIDAVVDGRCDIYGLGGVAYFLLTGRPPFNSSDAAELITAHLSRTPLTLGTAQSGVPSDLAEIVMKCLEKQPDLRFQTVTELEQAFAGCVCAGLWNAGVAAEWWREKTSLH